MAGVAVRGHGGLKPVEVWSEARPIAFGEWSLDRLGNADLTPWIYSPASSLREARNEDPGITHTALTYNKRVTVTLLWPWNLTRFS